jgi:hypothetical protein
MGQSIGRKELERRRLLAAGMVTVAGAEDGAAGLAQVKQRAIRVTTRFADVPIGTVMSLRAPSTISQVSK